jgi:hypothetical protein
MQLRSGSSQLTHSFQALANFSIIKQIFGIVFGAVEGQGVLEVLDSAQQAAIMGSPYQEQIVLPALAHSEAWSGIPHETNLIIDLGKQVCATLA